MTASREPKEASVTVFLVTTIGTLALAAAAEFLLALRAASYTDAVPVRARPGRRELP